MRNFCSFFISPIVSMLLIIYYDYQRLHLSFIAMWFLTAKFLNSTDRVGSRQAILLLHSTQWKKFIAALSFFIQGQINTLAWGTMDSHCFGLKYNNFLLLSLPKKFLSLPKYYQDVSRLSTQINDSSLAWKKRFHGQALARSICKFLCAQSRCLQKPFKKTFSEKAVFFC